MNLEKQQQLEKLAESMPDSAMAVGELQLVQEDLRGIIAHASSGDLRIALEDYIASIDVRIEKMDEGGEARRWRAEWRAVDDS
ncbi:MAG: hypothetical protein ACTHM9_12050 [Gemmatimonadales bacterium]